MNEYIVVSCPWCGESFETPIDLSVTAQTYTEDCQVCCRPLVVSYRQDEDGEVSYDVYRE